MAATSSSSGVGGPEQSARVKELEKALRVKDDKVKGYRDIIVRLKEEFLKTEEKFATETADLRRRHKDDGGVGASGADGRTVRVEEMKALKEQLAALHDGMRQAKSDVDKAARIRERLVAEKNHAEEALHKMEADLHKTEQQMTNAQNQYHRLRKELEDSRKKETRLRERLKDMLEGGGGGSSKETMAKAKERIESLEREVDLLTTQNAALKQHGATAGAGAGAGAGGAASGAAAPGGGRLLGVGTGEIDENRRVQHERWEEEKKLQKRFVPCLFLSFFVFSYLILCVSNYYWRICCVRKQPWGTGKTAGGPDIGECGLAATSEAGARQPAGRGVCQGGAAEESGRLAATGRGVQEAHRGGSHRPGAGGIRCCCCCCCACMMLLHKLVVLWKGVTEVSR
jgi:hypothetical protein